MIRGNFVQPNRLRWGKEQSMKLYGQISYKSTATTQHHGVRQNIYNRTRRFCAAMPLLSSSQRSSSHVISPSMFSGNIPIQTDSSSVTKVPMSSQYSSIHRYATSTEQSRTQEQQPHQEQHSQYYDGEKRTSIKSRGRKKSTASSVRNFRRSHGEQTKDGRFRGTKAQDERKGGASRRNPSKLEDQEVFVSCLPGLESILSAELTALGIPHRMASSASKSTSSSSSSSATSSPKTGAFLTSPSQHDLFRCHLYLGSASTLTISCGPPFYARGLAELKRKTSRFLPWNELLLHHDAAAKSSSQQKTTLRDVELELDVRVTTSKSKLYHSNAIRERILKAIYDSLGYDEKLIAERLSGTIDADANPGSQSTTSSDDNDVNESLLAGEHDTPNGVRKVVVPLDVNVYHDNVEIHFRSCIRPLHQRGYRLATAKAPLREDLAYAMLWAAGWFPSYHDKKEENERKEATEQSRSVHGPDDDDDQSFLLDPFCGSGTIVIEAARMKAGVLPGISLPEPFAGTCHGNGQKWEELIQRQRRQQQQQIAFHLEGNDTRSKFKIMACDRDRGAVDAARSNMERAGVGDYIDIRQLAFSRHPWLDHDRPRRGRHQIQKAEDQDEYGDDDGNDDENLEVDEVFRGGNLYIVTNPPFGKRVSPEKKRATRTSTTNKEGMNVFEETMGPQLLPLYQKLGQSIHRLVSVRGGGKDTQRSGDDGTDNQASQQVPPHKQRTPAQSGRTTLAILTDDLKLIRRTTVPLKVVFKSKHGGLPVFLTRFP